MKFTIVVLISKIQLKSELDFISAKTNETASFFVKQKESRVCIQTSEPNKIIKHSIQIGDKETSKQRFKWTYLVIL